ncbi:MAG: hypothetical protein F6K39_17980 [Okeania sp. SIO3B3]|nr:hypothetical protein [Okeania sp. SIO3B3]
MPIGIGEIIEKAKTAPLGEWQLNLSDDEYEDKLLLDDEGVPTELCEELAAEELDYNNPDSFQRQIFESIKNLAESSKNPDITYTQIRVGLHNYLALVKFCPNADRVNVAGIAQKRRWTREVV